MKIFYPATILGIIIIFLNGCSTSSHSIFSKKTPREKYEEQVIKTAGKTNPVVNAWLNAGEFSLNHPVYIPENGYNETGAFNPSNITAASFSIAIKRGRKLTAVLTEKDNNNFKAYMDIWHAGDTSSNRAPVFISSADTSLNFIEFVASADENVIIRFQPEIGSKGNYELKIRESPSLAFPIPPNVKSNIGSFWGDGRDGGARKHEGVDIMAAKRSLAVAVASGVVSDVSENEIGGKVVSIRPYNRSYSVYYAHLDTQFVSEGQRVNEGDVLGLTGNTGNARNTVSHLHFGIYTPSGAVDPLLYIKPVNQPDTKLVSLPSAVNMITVKKAAFYSDALLSISPFMLDKNYPVTVEAATGKGLRISLPDGRKGYMAVSSLKAAPAAGNINGANK